MHFSGSIPSISVFSQKYHLFKCPQVVPNCPLLTRRIHARIHRQRHQIPVVPERVLQLSHQRRKLLLMLIGLLIDRSLRNAHAALQTRPERPEAALDLARPIGRPLPRQIQPIEVVRLHQGVRTVDERHAAGAVLQHRIVTLLGVLLVRLAIGVAAHRQQELERRETGAQLREQAIVALALVEIEARIESFEFVGGAVDAGMAVDDVRAEVEGVAEVVDGELAETWMGGGGGGDCYENTFLVQVMLQYCLKL